MSSDFTPKKLPRRKDIKEAVERNIAKLFKCFYDNPAIFLSESDVQCYLYALLINDPFFMDFHPILKCQTPKEKSETLLVHADMMIEIGGKMKKYDISILKPSQFIDFSAWEDIVGIEIKYNRRLPAARKEKSNILEDAKKVKDNELGYVLWLNWDREINDSHLKKVKDFIRRYSNVSLFYLDLCSEPIKTNVTDLL